MSTTFSSGIVGALMLAVSSGGAATIIVTSTNQSGAGSLRQAITDANASPGADVIAFAIPGAGPHIIAPLSPALPDITQPLTIDGFTQPGASPNTLANGNNAVLQIRLDGAGAFGANGLRLRAADCQVRGLSITRFAGEGVVIIGGTNCVIAGNFIGLAPDGTARANNGSGVQVFDSPGNRIGGTAPAERNVLSGNFTAGVHMLGAGASNNAVEGNFIGTSPDGSAARANFVNGVYLQDAPRNRIGGAVTGARNVISGNAPDGVRISGSESSGNIVLGNFIGPSPSGMVALGSQNGVNIDGGAMNRVGGSAAGEGNVIAGNSGFGVRLDFSSSANVVLGNRIGVGPSGSGMQNGAQGILIRGSANRLGGTNAGEGNEIANNAPGMEVELGAGNAIRGNSIHDNRPRFAVFGGLGIDLAPFGLTANDGGDGDGGVNLLQNFPLLTAANASGASTRVQGTLNSRESAMFSLDFFSSPDCDPSGHGEGFKYLGSTSVTTDGGGNASFDVTLPVAAEGRQITATATDAGGNTSEFSPCFAASVLQPPQTFFVTNTNDSGPGSLRQALLDAQASPASENNIVAFNLGAGGGGAFRAAGAGDQTFTIRLTAPLAPIFEGVTIDGFTQPGASANTLPDGNNTVWRIRLDGSLLGAGANGLTLDAEGCEVRGLEVTGFRGSGIHFASGGDSGFVQGCHLLNNQTDGLCVDNASNVTIGGTTPEDRNVIHANGQGIQILEVSATGNVVLGNWIGPDPTGAGGSGNFGEGVFILDASGNVIGGTAPGAGNRIAFNSRAGVSVFSGSGNNIIGNSIGDNAGLGIELFPGANGNLAAPIITSATILANGTQCAGTFPGNPNTAYTLHASSSDEPFDGGEIFLGAGTAVTDGSGAGNFNFTASAGTFVGRHLTVTVTGPNEGTSPFSTAFTPSSVRPPGTFPVTVPDDDGPGSVRQALADANNYLAAGNNLITFNIPGTGVHVIRPLTPLELPAEPVTIDGFTQPGSQPNTQADEGYNGVHLIQLDGTLQGGGPVFSTTAEGSIFRGLSITRFGQALQLGGVGGNVLQGCLIGVDPAFRAAGNTDDGIEVTSPNNLVGGTNPAERNVIGANEGSGIVLATPQAHHNDFHGNLFGFRRNSALSANQFFNLGNGEHGIRFRFGASDNVVGSENPAAKNIFAFNTGNAVNVESGLGNKLFNCEYLFQSPFQTRRAIAVAPGANGNILPPKITYARRDSFNVRLGIDYTGLPNTTHQVEAYFGERVAGAPFDLRKFARVHQFNLTTDGAGRASTEEVVAGNYETYTRAFATIRDPAGNTSAASDLVTVVPAGSADLETRLFAPATAMVGSNFSVTIVVTNNGPATATNVTVRQILAPGVEIVSVSVPGTHTVYDGFVDYSLGNVAAGETRTITVTARGTRPTSYQFSANAHHQGVDPNFRNNVDQRTVQIVPAAQTPQADLEVNGETPEQQVTAGEVATYRFLVSNRGLNDASGVRAAIILPSGTIVESVAASSSMRCEAVGGAVSCTMDTLLAGGTVEITLRARVTGDEEGIRTFTIKADSTTTDANLRNNQAWVPVGVETRLAIDGDNETINWPANLADMELQSTTDVTPPATWTAVPNNSIITANGLNTYSLNPRAEGGPPERFFRLAEKPPVAPQAEFNQVSMELDGVQLPFTDWGQVSLKLPLSDSLRYVNVSYNDDWVIQNVPVLSGLNGGVADRVSLNFPLGTYGTPVFTANTGFSVTTNPVTGPPPSTAINILGVECHAVASGEQEVVLTYTPAQPLVGGPGLRTAQAKPNFPNREQRKNECAPAAIVNSLQYLDAVFGLNLSEADIRLQTIKDAMRWDAAGAPVGDDLLNAEWVQGKKQHMSERNLPIVTEVTTNPSLALAAVRSMYDVEIRMTGHVACVVGMADLGDGRYTLTLAHDVGQGKNGGNVLEVVTLDTNTGKLYSTTWSPDFVQFIIERPE